MRTLILFMLSGIAVYAIYSYNTRPAAENISDRRVILTPGSDFSVTSDMNDAADPIRENGIDLTIGEDKAPKGDLKITVTSSNADVVPNSNLLLSGTGTTRNLKIKALSPGYTTITVTITDGNDNRSFIIQYAASQTTNIKSKRWHAGISDASAAIDIDDDYMIVANDESNAFYLFDRKISGPPVKSFDYNQGNSLHLKDSSAGLWKEVDVEAAARGISNPSVTFWIGSMSNNGSYINKPNRNRLFAVSISGKGPATDFKNLGFYDDLRQKLIEWGDQRGYNFTMSAAVGQDSKAPDGFNIEGMVFGPDNKTMFIGFRAPLVPIYPRTKAIIAPIYDFEQWFNNGSPIGDPVIGNPIELDLGVRGIRDIIRLPNGQYIIIAGSCGFDLMPAAYSWTGKPNDKPVLIQTIDLTGLNVEGVIPVSADGKFQNKIQVLTDNGNEIFYCDTLCAKDLIDDRFKKFSSVIFPLDKK